MRNRLIFLLSSCVVGSELDIHNMSYDMGEVQRQATGRWREISNSLVPGNELRQVRVDISTQQSDWTEIRKLTYLPGG